MQLAEYVVLAWTTAFIGRAFGEVALAGSSLGFMTFNLGFSLQRSFILALDTQAPQAFGAGRLAGVGGAVQRAGLCALILSCVVGPAMWLASPLLLWLGQPLETVQYASVYLRCLSVTLPVHALFDSLARFLWAQEVLWPPLYAAGAGLVAQAVWVCLVGDTLGFAGAACAPVAAYTTMLLCLAGLVAVYRPFVPGTWQGLRLADALRTRGNFFSLSIACAFGESSEWWWWEIVGIHVGTFGPEPAAAHAIGYTLVPLLIMIPNSIGIALCNVIGRQLGAGDIKAAKKTALVTVSSGTALAVAYSVAVYVQGSAIAGLFTTDVAVLDTRRVIWPWVCAFLVVDALFGMLAGLNRALGIQGWSARCVFVCLWLLGTPLIFAFASSVERTWVIVPFIYAYFAAALLCCSACSDWRRLAEKADEAQFGGKVNLEEVLLGRS